MPKYNVKLIIIISLLIFILILSISVNKNNRPQVCIKQKCFKVEIADSTEEREKGLMHRKLLKEDQGMLFIFEKEDTYTFWMKNTLILLDIIWIDKDKKIVEIKSNILSCKQNPCPSYIPKENALYVLEINAGLAEKYNFEEGDTVNFKEINI